MIRPQSGASLMDEQPPLSLDSSPPSATAAVIWGLGITQIIGYGTLYYGFSILAAGITKDFNWPIEWVYGAFSAALLLAGFAAPFAGRWLDRFGAGQVMAAGSVGAALALAGCALAPGPATFVAALIAMEAAATLVLYDAAFAALAQISGQNARRSITHLTLIAGFASTLFWPLTSALDDWLGWRGVNLLFAALHLAVCLPIHIMLAQQTSGRGKALAVDELTLDTVSRGGLDAAERTKAFWLVMLGFTLSGFVLSALLVHMVPLLEGLGFGAAGIFMASLFGPAQVLIRVLNMTFGADLHPLRLAVIASAMIPAAATLLIAGISWQPVAFAFALLFGFGSGLSSIVRGTVPLALFGSRGYGERLGKLTAVRLVVTSVAPFIFAWVMQHYGAANALWSMAFIGLLAVAAFAMLMRLPNTLK